jgi:hypothetical protein
MGLTSLIWTIIVVLVAIWLISVLAAHVSSGLIHLLLVVAVIMLIINLITGSRRRTL